MCMTAAIACSWVCYSERCHALLCCQEYKAITVRLGSQTMHVGIQQCTKQMTEHGTSAGWHASVAITVSYCQPCYMTRTYHSALTMNMQAQWCSSYDSCICTYTIRNSGNATVSILHMNSIQKLSVATCTNSARYTMAPSSKAMMPTCNLHRQQPP